MTIQLTNEEKVTFFHTALCNIGGYLQGYGLNVNWDENEYKEAKAKLESKKRNQGIASDPKQDAQDLYDYHQALVSEAKAYIEYGVASLTEFAEALGEKVTKSIKQAWEEANGNIPIIKKGEDLSYDFNSIDEEVINEEKVSKREEENGKTLRKKKLHTKRKDY